MCIYIYIYIHTHICNYARIHVILDTCITCMPCITYIAHMAYTTYMNIMLPTRHALQQLTCMHAGTVNNVGIKMTGHQQHANHTETDPEVFSICEYSSMNHTIRFMRGFRFGFRGRPTWSFEAQDWTQELRSVPSTGGRSRGGGCNHGVCLK